jgi:hypothetical protein
MKGVPPKPTIMSTFQDVPLLSLFSPLQAGKTDCYSETIYHLLIKVVKGAVGKGVTSIIIDGVAQEEKWIKLVDDNVRQIISFSDVELCSSCFTITIFSIMYCYGCLFR